jgi:hypothetical protein
LQLKEEMEHIMEEKKVTNEESFHNLEVDSKFIHTSAPWLITYIDRDFAELCERDFAAGVHQSLKTGDTGNHVGIFDPALWTVASDR